MVRNISHPSAIFGDWRLFEQALNKGTEGRVLINDALTKFMRLGNHPVLRAQAAAFARTGVMQPVSAFATGDDFPTTVLEVLEKYHQTTYLDNAWEQIFNIRDMRGSRRSGFEILDVTGSLTFSKTLIGEKARLYKMYGEKTTVSFDLYSGGLHWSRLLFDDEEYWTLEDNAIQFRNKAVSSKAQDHYDLIEATAATYDLALQTADDSGVTNATIGYTALRDIKTINTACVNIINRLKNLGMGIAPSSQFIILAPIELRERITLAVARTAQAYAGSPAYLQYNVVPLYTAMLSDTSKYYVIFPKNKITGGNRMDLTIMSDFNITNYSELAVGWIRYGAAIAEEKQLVRCATS